MRSLYASGEVDSSKCQALAYKIVDVAMSELPEKAESIPEKELAIMIGALQIANKLIMKVLADQGIEVQVQFAELPIAKASPNKH